MRVSRLAIVALVIAVVPCCHLFGMFGAGLGVVSLWRIRASRGALGGRRTALAAVLLGAALSVIWAGLIEHVVSSSEAKFAEATVRSVTLVVRQPADAAERIAADGVWRHVPPRAALDAFRDTVAQRYGPLDRVTIVASSGALVPGSESAIALHFGADVQLGAVRFHPQLRVWPFAPEDQITGLVIEDPQLGDLRIGEDPPGAGANAGANAGAGTEAIDGQDTASDVP